MFVDMAILEKKWIINIRSGLIIEILKVDLTLINDDVAVIRIYVLERGRITQVLDKGAGKRE